MRDYQVVRTYEEVDALVKELEDGPDVVAFDLETGYVSAETVDKRALNTRHPDFIVVGFSITNSKDWARYIPLRHDNDRPLEPIKVWEKFRKVFETKEIIAHNASFERAALASLYRAGDVERPLEMKRVGHDTMIMANVLGKYKEVGLKALTREVLGESQTEYASLFGAEVMDKTGTKIVSSKVKKTRFNSLPVSPEVVNYGCDDSALCMELFEVFYPQLDETLKRIYSVEMQILLLMSQAEEFGVGVDWAGIQEAHNQYLTFRPKFETKVREEFAAMTVDPELKELARHANFGSPKQMRALLYEGLGMKTTRTSGSGEMSTDAKALEALSRKHVAVRSLLSLREIDNMGRRLKKWLDEYSDCFDGRVHPSFNQVRVISGRFAASDPAIQQLPKDWLWSINTEIGEDGKVKFIPEGTNGEDYWTGNFRKFVIAGENKTLCTFDYANQEIRVLTGLTQEPAMLKGFAKDQDPHRIAASLVFNKPYSEVSKSERQAAKGVQFGILYGQGAKSLGEQLALDKEEAEGLIDAYKSRLSKVGQWDAQSRRQGVADGFVTSWFGRKMTLWAASSPDPYTRSGAERLAVNAQIQGGAADYTKLAMIRAWALLKQAGLWGTDKVMLTMNQHDSLTFEVSDDLDMNKVRDILQEAVVFDARKMFPKLQIPVFPRFDVDWELGKTWGGSIPWPLEEKATKTETGWAVGSQEDTLEVQAWSKDETVDTPQVQVVHLVPEALQVVWTGKVDKARLQAFTDMLKSNSGDTIVYFTMKGQTKKLATKTALSGLDANRISFVLGGAEVHERTIEEMEEML